MRQLSKKIKLFFILSFIFASLHTHNHEEHHEHEANVDNFEINCLLCDLVKKSTVDVKVFLSNYHKRFWFPPSHFTNHQTPQVFIPEVRQYSFS